MMKPVRPILAVVVAFAGVGCGPPAPTTPVTVGEKIKSKHGSPAGPTSPQDATKQALEQAKALSPGKDKLGEVPPGIPSPHGTHGSPGVVNVGGNSAIARAADTDVVLKVDNQVFTKQDLLRSMKQAAALAGIPPDMLDLQMQEAFEQPAYEKLIERTLLVKEARRRGLWPDDKEATRKREEMLKTLPEGKNLADVLAALGADQKSFEDDLRVDLAIAKLLEAIEKGVPTPPSAVIDGIYESNKSVFTIPDTAAAAHILVKADRASGPEVLAEKKKRAEEIKAEVMGKEPAVFARVAAEKSDDASSRERGGDLGLFKRGDLFPEFEAVAFKLKEGEIAGPVQTDRGFHIIRGGGVEKGRTVPAKEAKSIIAERERVKGFLAAVDDLVEELRKGATIERIVEPVPSPLVDPNDRGSRVPNWRATGKNAMKGMMNPHDAPALRMPSAPSP
jgi:parvulin-like peptidyl-prolyl isomerase